MKERPIIFSAAMVRAILEGRKTQTRRIIKAKLRPNALLDHFDFLATAVFSDGTCVYSKYGTAGDRLWVRETWQPNTMPTGWPYYYRATDEDVVSGPWKSPIFMPRVASRILLEITDVRVERVQEITERDAMDEGVMEFDEDPGWFPTYNDPDSGGNAPTYADYQNQKGWFYSAKESFESLWQSIHGPASWEQNPWVWVIEFKKIDL